jgi:invasion protein IalB
MIHRPFQSSTSAVGLALVWLVVAATVPAFAQATRAVNKFGDWTLYDHQDGAARICFLAAAPRTSAPKDDTRAAPQFFISGWPKDGVKGEISVKLGYAAKRGSPVTATVGRDAFRMFANGDRAFVQDATAELKLIEAFKKGATVIVQATSEAGVTTTDSYSLQGLTQGLQTLAAGCG